MTSENGKYKLVPPDGGYAHLINVATILILTFTLAPISTFALIFGPFLSQYYDETSSITIVTSVYVSLLHLTGLLANCFLQRFSYRKVALIGAFLHVSGGVISIFTVNLVFLTMSYGVIQGLGAGLLIPSSLSAINAYYDVKKPTAMAIGQTMVALLSSGYPAFTRILLENYGFRGTQTIFAAVNLNILVGALLLQPVEKHLKRKSIVDGMCAAITSEVRHFLECCENHLSCHSKFNLLENSSSASDIVIHDDNEEVEEESNNVSFMDYTVLKDGWYWNIAIGLAISFISETNFMAILPVSLAQMGLATNEVTLMMTIYFITDLISRVIFSVITLIWSLSVRLLFLINIIFTIILRIVFMFKLPFWFLTILTGVLGVSRCLIQVLVVMVIAEGYSKVFTSAFSFYMVFNGLLSIAIGALMGSMTHHMHVLYIQTSILLICAVPWTFQYIYLYKTAHNHRKLF